MKELRTFLTKIRSTLPLTDGPTYQVGGLTAPRWTEKMSRRKMILPNRGMFCHRSPRISARAYPVPRLSYSAKSANQLIQSINSILKRSVNSSTAFVPLPICAAMLCLPLTICMKLDRCSGSVGSGRHSDRGAVVHLR
jgi:hypothetical protein